MPLCFRAFLPSPIQLLLRLLLATLRMDCSVLRALSTRRLIASEAGVSPGKLTRSTMRVRMHGTLVGQAYSQITWQRPRAPPLTPLEIARPLVTLLRPLEIGAHVCHVPLACSLTQISRCARRALLARRRKAVSPVQLAAMGFTAPMGLS
eukprot:COSAG02_NODE_8061_length_2728_cov_1.689996_1_plen_149_part_10